jgi:hypothetical protein
MLSPNLTSSDSPPATVTLDGQSCITAYLSQHPQLTACMYLSSSTAPRYTFRINHCMRTTTILLVEMCTTRFLQRRCALLMHVVGFPHADICNLLRLVESACLSGMLQTEDQLCGHCMHFCITVVSTFCVNETAENQQMATEVIMTSNLHI